MTVTLAIAAAALTAGYALGRWRPWNRLHTYVWRAFTFGGPWTRSKPRRLGMAILHTLVRPRVTAGICAEMWRHRNDPPKPTRSPAVTVRTPARDTAHLDRILDDRLADATTPPRTEEP